MTANWWAQVPLVALVFARCGGFFAVAPPVNVRQFPLSLRLAASLVLAVALAPTAAAAGTPTHLSLGLYVALLVREFALGLSLGISAALVFWAFLVAGQLVDVWLGTGEGGARARGHGVLATLLYLTAGAAFLAVDAHHCLITALGESLRQLPIGEQALGVGGLQAAAALGEQMLLVGVALAAPALAVMLAVELALGSFVRLLPQLHAADLPHPVRWSAGILGLAASAPLLAQALLTHSSRVVAAVQEVVRLLSAGG